MIPENIKAEEILRAIKEVEKLGIIPSGRDSEKYDLEYNGKLYPPNYIISLANKYSNGKELDHSEFGGGKETINFLQSLGFNIVGKQNDIDEDDLELQVGDFAPRLQDYLENIYSINVDKSSGRAHLSFPSGAVVHVRGSIILKDHRGFYSLQEEDYKDIINNTNRFFAVVFGDPEKTFVFPREGLKTFFDGHPLTYPLKPQDGNKPKWYFDIREEDDKHYLRVRSGETNEVNTDIYLNKWDQIEDFKHLSEKSEHIAPNYWMLVVKDQPEQNLTASQILVTRMNDKFWGLNARTPSRALLRRNDKVIFSHGAREFLGTATLDSDSFELPEQEKALFSHDRDIFKADFGIKLRDTVIWQQQKPVKQYLDVLSFVKRKEQYPVYFQGGVKKLSEKEFESITNISQPKNPLSFIDLQNFLLKEMEMRANYQPIMIKTLLLSGGKLTRDKIAEKIKELNSEKEDQDFKNIPVYDVLEKRGVVRKYDNEFILNMTELTPEQSKQLIALCDWKILTLPLQLEELIEAFDKNKSLFDPDRITLEEREKLRLYFVSDFSIDKILEMKIDDYIAGKHDPQSNEVNKTTFCYRLEHNPESGIGGRNAQKFGIYFNRKIQNYDYNRTRYDSHEKAFDAIKSEIYTILQAGKQFKEDKNWNNLSDVLERDYNIYRQVRSKILSVYYPEDFIQIHSLKHLQVILEVFGKPTIDVQDKLFLTQARLLEVKNSHHVMKEWHNEDFSHFVWQAVIERKTTARESDEEYKSSSSKVSLWVVRAGSNGEQEKDALERDVVTIGWNQLPNLSSVNDKESLKQLYLASDPNVKEMAVANMVGSIWRFTKEIKKGDLVALPLLSQNSKMIAIGKVEGDYDYKELTPDIKHIRPVKWISKNISKSEFGEDIIKQLQIPMTVYQIKIDDIINTIKKVLQKSGITDIDIMRKTDDEKFETENKIPTIFVTGYDNENLSKSKELGILGWKYNSRLLSTYDLVFVFNKSNLNVESCFEMRSKSPNTVLIWPDELKSNQLIYKNRWEARLRNDNLGISLDTINKMKPFNKESFQLKTRDPFPMPLNSPGSGNKYEELCNLLLSKINYKETQQHEFKSSMNRGTVYEMIRRESINRKLNFEPISAVLQGGVEYGFIISGADTKIKIYGNILSNKIQGDEIYQAITKTLYDFYESNKGKNFVVVVDSVQNHFLTIPYNILKQVMYDRNSGNDINKSFHIGRNPYTLSRNKTSLSQYIDNLNVVFALDDLARTIHYTADEIEEIETRLIEKGQMIFYGPPGTGKTYVAKVFGEYFTGDKDNIKIIQFHPSYSYEDFVEGIRPNEEKGGFSKEPGIFKRFVEEECLKHPDEKFLLIIDEINRGDIPKIFGELIYLLPFRGDKITLTYSKKDEKFFIPANLYIICTMNSQDRSVTFLDYANRRRFSMIRFQPRYDILSSWLDKNSTLGNKQAIVQSLRLINEKISEKGLGDDYQIGHSYFMEDNLDRAKLKRIIDYDIKPLVEQYFFPKKDQNTLNEISQECDEMLKATENVG